MSQLFQYEVEVVSYRSDLRAKDLLGQSVTLNLQRNDENDALRHWNGLVASFEYLTTGDDGFSRYRIVLRPWLWQLTKSADCRIFQHQRIPEIITNIFRDRGYVAFDSELSETHAPREYVVQYRETDLAFVMRLMDREGIYFFFRHEPGKHTLVLTDAETLHEQAEGCGAIPFADPDAHRDATREYVRQWHSQTAFETGKFSLADFDFKRPRAGLYSLAAATSASAAEDQELYDYPGGFYTRAEADAYAKLRLEQARAQAEGWNGETNVRGLTVANTFQLIDHPLEDQNASYLVVASRTRLCAPDVRATGGPSNEDIYVAEFQAIEAESTFRTPLRTPGPIMRGPQTAIVVGPAGQEIWTDEYGRIKVQFHWDRQGKSDENASCWIRVAQAWAGSGFGAQFIPRIGQEVIVDFLEGDPDRPIVTGSVYNGANAPPFGLPRNSTQSGIRTRSSAGGAAPNANEIRFEDSRGGEELYLQAEKDMNTLVKNDQSLTVGRSRSVRVVATETIAVGLARAAQIGATDSLVVGVDATTAVGHNMSLSVGASATTSVAIDRVSTVGGSSQDSVGGNRTDVVEGSFSETVGGTATIVVSGRVDEQTSGARAETFGDDYVAKHGGHRVVVVGVPDKTRSATLHVEGPAFASATQTIDVSSLARLVIHCGKSEIRIEPEKITFTSPTVSIVSSKEVLVATPKATVAATGLLTLGGDSVKVTSSGASVVLDSNATVQGASVKLAGGSGASDQSNDKPPKVTTLEVKDQNGNPLANQRVILRKGGEGGDEQTVVLDEKGKIILKGDDAYDVFVPDVTDPKKN
jgi:type VI secretion system secreted protein VgrG